MLLAAGKGTNITVITDGEEASEGLAAIEELINDYFGEGG